MNHVVTDGRYTRVAIILHWAIAALILFNLAFGYFFEGFPPPLRGIVLKAHISAGMTVLLLTVARVAWRLTHEPPPYPPGMKPWERHLAHFVHFGLYAAMVLMPLLGWAIVSAHSPKGSPGQVVERAAFAAEHPAMARALPPAARPGAGPTAPPPGASGPRIWGLVPFPLIEPIEDIGYSVGGVKPQKELHDKFVTWHGLGGYITILLLILHVAGALKHQIVDKEREFARMGIGRGDRADDPLPEAAE